MTITKKLVNNDDIQQLGSHPQICEKENVFGERCRLNSYVVPQLLIMPTRLTQMAIVPVLATVWCVFPLITAGQGRPKPAPPLIKRTYDKFHDLTSVSPSEPILVGHNAMFSAHFKYSGTSQPQSIDTFGLLFIAPPSVWAGSGTSALIYVLLNAQQPAKKIEAKYSSTFRTENIVSTLYSTNVSQSEFRDIACSTKIEMRIGLMEGELTSKNIAALKALYEASGGTCR